MEYEDLDPRIPVLNHPGYGMPIAGFCLCVLNNSNIIGGKELVFVVGKMGSIERVCCADMTFGLDIDSSYNYYTRKGVRQILLYYPKDRRENKDKKPEFFHLRGLEKCIWLEETKTQSASLQQPR